MALIRRLVEIQRQLDEAADFPSDDPVNKALVALNAESHEALREMKPHWCWWKDETIDRARVREELIDCWFFYLSLIDKLAKTIPQFDLEHHEQVLMQEMFPHIRAQLKDSLTPTDETFFHLNVLNVNSVPVGPFDMRRLMMIAGALISASLLMGLDTVEIEEGYRAKARVNLERWGKQDLPLYAELA